MSNRSASKTIISRSSEFRFELASIVGIVLCAGLGVQHDAAASVAVAKEDDLNGQVISVESNISVIDVRGVDRQSDLPVPPRVGARESQ